MAVRQGREQTAAALSVCVAIRSGGDREAIREFVGAMSEGAIIAPGMIAAAVVGICCFENPRRGAGGRFNAAARSALTIMLLAACCGPRLPIGPVDGAVYVRLGTNTARPRPTLTMALSGTTAFTWSMVSIRDTASAGTIT